MMDYTWFILGNGRRGYLERTIASWEANLVSKPKNQYIFDDSGNEQHRDWLVRNYSDRFKIVFIDQAPAGHVTAMRKIFDTMRDLDTEYFLGIEEDWMLFRPLELEEIFDCLETNKNILQMRIPRTIWHSSYHKLDIDAGSILLHHLNDPKNQISRQVNNKWFEVRSNFYFWSHNPSVFNKKIFMEDYPKSNSHEYDFGISLLKKYSDGVIGFWATNPYDAYITHIGFREEKLLRTLPEHRGYLGDK
jgi:hypothetical protein